MAQESFSSTIKNFLNQYIQSVEDLDVLLLVRSAPTRDWSATDVSDELRMDPISASNRLMGLSLQGLLDHRQAAGRLYHYRYRPPRALEKIASELATLYETHRAELIDHVARHQRGQMFAFADAFTLKKDK